MRLAHMAQLVLPLFINGQRIDRLWNDRHKQALADYHANYHRMYHRYLQEDGLGVLWHDREGEQATLWNFADREIRLTGSVCDMTAGHDLPPSASYQVKACHTYVIRETTLPKYIG